jgi:hypothetical protein
VTRDSHFSSNTHTKNRGAKRARTADLLHAIWRQRVHPRLSVQVTVLPRPRKSARVRVSCCTSVLYRCHSRRRNGRGPDAALTSVDPPRQATGGWFGVHPVNEAPAVRSLAAPRNLSPLPAQAVARSADKHPPGAPKLYTNFPYPM